MKGQSPGEERIAVMKHHFFFNYIRTVDVDWSLFNHNQAITFALVYRFFFYYTHYYSLFPLNTS